MSKVALVTGGNRGIGLGITRRLLADGYSVAILATRPEPTELIDDLRQTGQVLYVQGSVSEPSDHASYVDTVLDAWGRIDVLVNNAGVAPSPRADRLQVSKDSVDRVKGINLRGPYFLTQRVANAMIEQRRDDGAATDSPIGTIVNVSPLAARSVATSRGARPGASMATQLFAARLAPAGIAVYEVRPSATAAEASASAAHDAGEPSVDGGAPVSDEGMSPDIATAVSALVSGQTSCVTGEIFHIDAGIHAPPR
ncbi:SDR family oxidoreductase [Sanguibacter antarcticus]|uniref:NAD(P)-dependent dehydrogenase (Short-subunit alcohol dehydrogenase family) n=1 Tax=Sanguibacter antarcticus TaxID=372484 RepID=A0A2A9E5Y0_9MICO|nr:SDR family oxidoreductase [Sanguibacter antarcticus]PFG34243.1 NAD(P)-dependent dehydrogenase (short-subunit alcohol dehydrogenase family) [Sanguibacter antarcticus]